MEGIKSMKNFIITGLASLVFGACAQMPQKTETGDSSASVAPLRAQAVLKVSPKTNLRGTVEFSEINGELTIRTEIEGLKPGAHGFHIHDKGDCSSGDFNSAGPHFNPGSMAHGSMDSEVRHAGDLGNLTADRKGNAKQVIVLKGLSLVDGAQGLIGRAVIIHNDPDDLKTQPTGNSGKRIACGVIEAVK
jgi:Cu-Zn family superoxide dismutase